MKVLHRILAAPLVAAGLFVACGLGAHVAIGTLTSRFEEMRDDKLKTSFEIGNLKQRMANLSAHLYREAILAESQDPERNVAARKHVEAEAAAIEAGFAGLPVPDSAELAERLKRVPELMKKYRARADQGLSMSESSAGGGALMLTSAQKSFGESFAIAEAVAKAVDDEVRSMSAEVVAVSSRSLQLIWGLTLLAIAASLAIAYWSARHVVRRLDDAIRLSDAVARGELDVRLPASSDDELGHLLKSLGASAQRLADSIRSIQQASVSIDTAASEIAAGSMDLSTRTELTAGSLDATTSAMDEMGRLVEHGGQTAVNARELAGSASTLAGRGGKVVSDVVATMSEINDSSKKIAEITGVIDGIAFQTNILALNAAVEAARAGEQGRGFAVVAGEVRALAQRSAAAAKEIKSLIGASVEKAERGATLVSEAGGTMQQIVLAVRRVDETIAELSSMTTQQNHSLDGVTQTLRRFDQMTQENAALAEQSAAASESLRTQSSTLTKVVSLFKLPEATRTGVAAAA